MDVDGSIGKKVWIWHSGDILHEIILNMYSTYQYISYVHLQYIIS